MEFSIIITADNVEDTETTLNSLINQKLKFEEHVDVIIIGNTNDNHVQKLFESYSEKYPKNFKLIENSPSIYSSKNTALEYANGKYINFINSGDTFTNDTLKNVLAFFNENNDLNLISVPIFFIKENEKNHKSNARFDKAQVIDLNQNPQYYQIFPQSSFIKKDATKDIQINEVDIREDIVFIDEVLIDNPKIGLCKHGKCYTHFQLVNNISLEDAQAGKDYYFNLCENYFEKLINKSLEKYGKVPKFIQNGIMYDLSIMLDAKDTENILDEGEIGQFKSMMKGILGNIDDEVILDYDFSIYSKINAFLLKYEQIPEPILQNFDLNTVFIDTYDIINDELRVLANFPNIFNKDVKILVNDKKIDMKIIRYPQKDKKYFDYTYMEDYSFEFSIPLSTKEKFEIEFISDGQPLSIDFSRPCNFSRIVGYAKTKKYLSKWNGNNITIEPKTIFKWIKYEAKSLIKILKERKPGYKVGVPFRLLYMLAYPFFRNKKIWFYMDRPEVSDDNGMHLFKYVVDKDPDIKKYFILNKDSPDFKEMEKIGKVIGFKSIKHRFLGMFVENIVTSQPDNEIIYPFWGTYPHIAGLLKSNTIFLQHGIIKEDISSWVNKSNMNLSFFLTSAPLEYKSILTYPYNYGSDVVQLLGLPRYDNLENKEDKKIVIMPSWRRYLTRKSDEYIKNSEFFKKFNSLINNEKLIEYARENNYEIIFRPHPKVYNFINLFDENDYVKIDFEKTRYQELFNTGSVLITDYSSVAFDFAYLKKPIIYYQYAEDYHFDREDSFFEYETMGFGEVIKSEDELIDLLIEYMENDCQMKNEYVERVENFFIYTDKNNCKRVYDKIKEIPLKD